MKTRLALVAGGVVVLLLAAAAPALATRSADAGTPYGWLLQLRGAKWMAYKHSAYQAWQKKPGVKATVMVDEAKTPEDASDDVAYTGIGLWRLVGRID
ncbi:MAG: hypothetical protein GX624_11455, partial [Actinobacteria bacterium]|nr:hypothetical protein [Actinomycetota bacterium]